MLPNPYIWQRVTLDLVYGRNDFLAAIRSDLSSGRSVALVGGRKIGKTTVIRKLEAQVLASLASGDQSEILVPAYVDTLALAHPTNQFSIYFEVLRQFDKNLEVVGLNCNLLKKFEGGVRAGSPEFAAFRVALVACIREVSNVRKLRLAALIDEVEPITEAGWSSGFFGNWRHLISNDPELSSHVVCLFSGAKEMAALSSAIGSPIANVLSQRMLEPLTWAASRALVNEPTKNDLPLSVARRVFTLSGGHPFLIQFLMQQIWSSVSENMTSRVDAAQTTFLETQAGQFLSWWNTRFSDGDRKAYLLISRSRAGTSAKELSTLLTGLSSLSALASLRTYGVVRKCHGDRYKTNGTLFRTWVTGNVSVGGLSVGSYDRHIYEKLYLLNAEIAKKYVSAWAIQNAALENYSGAVSEMRDVLTLTLHRLAPDAEVTADREYVADTGEDGKPLKTPSRRRRIEFIVRKRSISSSAKMEQEIELFETLAQQLGGSAARGYGRASAKTHTTAERDDAWRCLKQLESILAQVL